MELQFYMVSSEHFIDIPSYRNGLAENCYDLSEVRQL